MRSVWVGCMMLASGFVWAETPVFVGPGNRDCADCPEMVVVPAGLAGS